jgi:nucleoside-diphosphate-sugar epimerase
MNIDSSKPVLVTGANGYVASWLVKQLLEAGHTVHATVRNPNDESKVGHLNEVAATAAGELKFFKADLLEDGAFDEPMRDCELVFHTASPFVQWNITDPQAQLIQPAKRGTLNVLESVERVASVKRVVLTTSVAAIFGDNKDMQAAGLDCFTEDHWNTTSNEHHQAYSYSKTVAEQVAWEAVEGQERWDLVCINPAFVMGPSLSKSSQSTSLSTIKELVNGTNKMGVPKLEFGLVDVRDVANAHYQAGFTPTAKGRHICSAQTSSMMAMADSIRKKYPQYPLPKTTLPKIMTWAFGPIVSSVTRNYVANNVGYPVRFDNSKIRNELGVTFRSVDETLHDHMQQLLDDGIIRPR